MKAHKILLAVLAVCLCIVIKDAYAETVRMIVNGYTEERGFPENGVRGQYRVKEKLYPIDLPDGLTVEAEFFSPESEYGYIALPGQSECWVQVKKSSLTRPEDYPIKIDFPRIEVNQRIAIYASIEEQDAEILKVAVKGDSLIVLASVSSYFYVWDQDSTYGFVSQRDYPGDGFYFYVASSHRYYDHCLSYMEEDYIAAEAPESCALSKEAAIQIAKDYVLACFPDESASHLSELGWAAYYNRAHEYGNWGMTWQIVCYGSTENQWILPNPYVYTSDSEMPYLNFREYMDSSFELLDGLSEIQQHRIYLNTGREDISDLHIHYVLTVVINRSTHQVFFLHI